MSSVILAVVLAFAFIYMTVGSEERKIAQQAANRGRKRDMSYYPAALPNYFLYSLQLS